VRLPSRLSLTVLHQIDYALVYPRTQLRLIDRLAHGTSDILLAATPDGIDSYPYAKYYNKR